MLHFIAFNLKDQEAQAAFLAAAKALAEAHHDPEFYQLAVKALTD